VGELSPPMCRSFSSTTATRDLRRAAKELDPAEDHLLVSGKRLGDYLTGRAIGRIALNDKIPQKDHQTFINFGGKKRKAKAAVAETREPEVAPEAPAPEVVQERAAEEGDLSVTDWTSTNTLTGVSFSNTLHGFPSVKEYEPVPGLRPTVCRVCKRYSQFLPQPNMCSMCLARARLIRERDQLREYERDRDLYWQKLHEQNDAGTKDEDRKELETTRALRAVVDERNVKDIEQRTLAYKTRSRDGDIGEALTTGAVKCSDPFDSRPDEIEDVEKKKRYREALRQQMKEDGERKHKLDEEERAYAEKTREREMGILNETRSREMEEKARKQRAQQEALEAQLAAGKRSIPGAYGYSAEGDRFTLRDEESKEEQRSRGIANENVLRWQRADVAERKRRALEKERADAAAAADMEREQMERDVKELIARDEEMKAKQAQELDKQIARKREFVKTRELEGDKDGTFAYAAEGDPFTQQEDAESIRRRKYERDARNHEALRRQVGRMVGREL
jgi:hypothetical protein